MGLSSQESQTFDARFIAIRGIIPDLIIPAGDRAKHDIRELKKGGIFRLEGKTYVVNATAICTETGDSYRRKLTSVTTELMLFCLETGEARWIEWSIDDGLEICLTERRLSSREEASLKYDDGKCVDLDDIEEIVEEEGMLVLGGAIYEYDDDWSARYESSDGRNFCVYIAEFGNGSGQWLTVEQWSDDGREDGPWDVEVYISHDVNPRAIEILSLGGNA